MRRLPSLRRQIVFKAVRRALGRTARAWFRIVHYSVQADHIHLLVEADDRVCLSRGIMGTVIRAARAVNGALGRSGRVWGDRYHARPLRTPREVRNGIVYVLMNWKKHLPIAKGLDPCSSAASFTGWQLHPPVGPPQPDEKVEAPTTWLLGIGWKRHGLLAANETPRASLVTDPD